MASEIFIDTGGFYASLDPQDQWRSALDRVSAGAPLARARYITTDYVLDETVTLLRARGLSYLAHPWLREVLGSAECRVEWMDPERFDLVREYFAKHDDKSWSFTDCFSFCVMAERGITKALAHDHHFRQAGFEPLLLEA